MEGRVGGFYGGGWRWDRGWERIGRILETGGVKLVIDCTGGFGGRESGDLWVCSEGSS